MEEPPGARRRAIETASFLEARISDAIDQVTLQMFNPKQHIHSDLKLWKPQDAHQILL